MAKISLTVCDKCGEMNKPTKTYTVEGGGRLTTLDLCVDDAKILVTYQGLVPPPDVGPLVLDPKPPRQTARQKARVTTMEELEQMKKAGTA